MRYSIKELRARNNMTQKDMASALGLSLTAYNYWENNIDRLTISKLKALCKVLNVSIHDVEI